MPTFAGHASRRREVRRQKIARARRNDLRSILSLMVYIRPSNDKDVFTTFVNGKETCCEQIKFNFSKNKVFVSPQGAGGKQVEYDMPKEPFARVLDLFSIWLRIRPEDRVSCTYAVLGEGDPGIALYNIKRVGDFLIKVDKSLRTYLHSFQLIPMLLMLSVGEKLFRRDTTTEVGKAYGLVGDSPICDAQIDTFTLEQLIAFAQFVAVLVCCYAKTAAVKTDNEFPGSTLIRGITAGISSGADMSYANNLNVCVTLFIIFAPSLLENYFLRFYVFVFLHQLANYPCAEAIRKNRADIGLGTRSPDLRAEMKSRHIKRRQQRQKTVVSAAGDAERVYPATVCVSPVTTVPATSTATTIFDKPVSSRGGARGMWIKKLSCLFLHESQWHNMLSKGKLPCRHSVMNKIKVSDLNLQCDELTKAAFHKEMRDCLGSFDKVETTVMQELYAAYQKLSDACNDTKSNGMELST